MAPAKKSVRKVAAKGARSSRAEQLQWARTHFRELLLANPNYFGTVAGSKFKPVLTLAGDTSYEELVCIGYHPGMRRLEGVAHLKRNAGYLGGLCTPGSQEYVRFYVSRDNGATWHDLGMTSFTAHDVPGTKPLVCGVVLRADLGASLCQYERLPLIRAILSWNDAPPQNAPNWTPPWGNVVQARVQLPGVSWPPHIEQPSFEIPEELKQAMEVLHAAAADQQKVLSVAELHAQYQSMDVPDHRTLFPQVQKLVAYPVLAASVMTAGYQGVFANLPGVNLATVIDNLLKTDGDTRFEQLDCIGLSSSPTGATDVLVGVLTVKLPYGYSGGLCSPGSQEYVAFWVDWDGAGYTYVGTATVTAHDIHSIPPEGLKYAVALPVDLTCRRQPCEQGPKLAKVRAILSWHQPPSTTDPDFVPTWGNRRETTILTPPGPVVEPTDHTPYLSTLGDVGTCDIEPTTGLATGHGVVGNFTVHDAPFGGVVTIGGFILNPPVAGTLAFRYKLFVREQGKGWQPLSNTFTITVEEQTGSYVIQKELEQAVDAEGYYTYREQGPVNGQSCEVEGNVLGRWSTSGEREGLWDVKMEVLTPGSTTPLVSKTVACPGKAPGGVATVFLDQTAPDAHIQITGFQRGAGPVQPAVDCGTFQVGDIIHGTYSVADAHFGSLGLSVEPLAPPVGALKPGSRTYDDLLNPVPTTGEGGTWTLDTKGMKPCGYVVRLDAVDRTNVNSVGPGWRKSDSVGFCLVKP